VTERRQDGWCRRGRNGPRRTAGARWLQQADGYSGLHQRAPRGAARKSAL